MNPTAYAAYSGDYSYVAAGAAMRNQGYGNISITWTGTLFKAYLVWGYIYPTQISSAGTFNGVNITGTFQSTDLSPCWGNGNLSVYAADVTSLVVNGINNLKNFPSGITDGSDPWSAAEAPLDEGASLIVIYVPAAAVTNQVYVYTGTYTETNGGSLTSVFDHGATIATVATTTFVIADGQLPYNTAAWNNATIDANAFSGSDPKTSTATWSYGNLWDTKTYSVPVALGSTQDNATITGSGGDCLTWAAQVLSFPSTAPITPPTTGVPQFGMPMIVVAVSFLGLAFLAKKKSSLSSKAS
ncbi:MAG: hypothetical protein ABSB56_08840 [Nitrososphaerales archaeon]